MTLLQIPVGLTLFYTLSMWSTLPDVVFYIGGFFIALGYGAVTTYVFTQLEKPHDIMPATTVVSSFIAIGGVCLLIMQQLTVFLRDRFAELTVAADGSPLFGTFTLDVTIATAIMFVAYVIPALKKHHDRNEILGLSIPIILYIIGLLVSNEFTALLL